MTKKLMVLVMIVVILGGLGYVVLNNKETEQDPKLLIGLWKTESSIFPDGEYLEMKETEFCSVWQTFRTDPYFRCSKYAPYIVSGNRVGFLQPPQPNTKWEVTGNTLTLWSGGDKGEKKLYERVDPNVAPAQTSFPEESIFTRDSDGNLMVKPTPLSQSPVSSKDSEKPKIVSFKASSQSVKTGGEISFMCSATDNSGSVQIAFDIAGLIEGGTANAFEGGPFRSSGDSHSYTYKPAFAGNYKVTCQVSDEAQNKTESSILFSVTP